jgi:glycine dehydrogenase subunit 1
VQLAERLAGVPGARVLNETFFNEFTVRLAKPAAPLVERLARKGVLAGVPVSRFYPKAKDLLLVAATETTTEDDIEIFATKLEEALR